MTEVIVSAAISVLLVLVETVGLILSKWYLTKRRAENAVHDAEAKAALEFIATELEYDEDPVAALAERLRITADRTRAQQLTKSLVGIVPGPEICFLSLTIISSLFLAFNYSSIQLRQSISPFLANTNSAFPILLGVVLLDLVMWIGVLIWREAIVMGIQQRLIKTSIALIVSIGGGSMTICVYLLIANRG